MSCGRRIGRCSALVIAACGLSACGSCGRSGPDRDASPAPPALVPADLPPAPRPWTFAPVRDPSGVALPTHCTERLPRVVAPVEASTRFMADRRTLAALAIAEIGGEPPRVTAAGASALDPAGPSREAKAIPWFDPSAVPHLARVEDGGWLGAFERRGAGGGRVTLWRSPGAGSSSSTPSTTSTEDVGEGDGFEPVDLQCGPTRCALLTTRLTRVAAPGAEVRVGPPSAPIASWTRIEIAPSRSENDAEPIVLGAVEPAVVAVVQDGDDALFWGAEGPAPRELGRLPAPHGILDALAAPTPVALVFGTEIGEDGCARGGAAKVRFERAGAAGIDVPTPSTPLAASLRRLSRGALATWIAPLGCGAARRVVFSVVLAPDGTPASEPMAVADGTSFAVAARGDDVDLWIQGSSAVTWIRARCNPP